MTCEHLDHETPDTEPVATVTIEVRDTGPGWHTSTSVQVYTGGPTAETLAVMLGEVAGDLLMQAMGSSAVEAAEAATRAAAEGGEA